MSAVIKSRNGVSGPVRSFVATSARQPDATIVPEERFAQERAALLTRIGVLEKQIQDQHAAATRAADEARHEGQAAGQAQAEDRQAERLALLAETLAVETTALGERLGRVEGLALSLAHAGLAKMFDAPFNMDAMVRSTLARHVATLVDQAILVVSVSKMDFADAGTLEALTVALGTHGARARIDIDTGLSSGACRLSYRLGQIELDVPQQWHALSSLLEDMAPS